MVQPAETLARKDATPSYGTTPAVRCSLPESEMRAVGMILADIIGEQLFQMMFNFPYASATFRMSFPVFAPVKSLSRVSGKVSKPSTMSSRVFNFPPAIQSASSRAASG